MFFILILYYFDIGLITPIIHHLVFSTDYLICIVYYLIFIVY